ncbi:hypothetical protein CPB84DRAFT_1766887 [Gymnopilus junonius]|uniref:Uncharacterized protein n=1 Tax=Gymnopilus junonius TaxID=109634 RepID=A0A9P5NTE7_GYMJU|nr:hypothetical protein CPB84DRAFT_1766887 [Gymnopilus junonius]
MGIGAMMIKVTKSTAAVRYMLSVIPDSYVPDRYATLLVCLSFPYVACPALYLTLTLLFIFPFSKFYSRPPLSSLPLFLPTSNERHFFLFYCYSCYCCYFIRTYARTYVL